MRLDTSFLLGTEVSFVGTELCFLTGYRKQILDVLTLRFIYVQESTSTEAFCAWEM